MDGTCVFFSTETQIIPLSFLSSPLCKAFCTVMGGGGSKKKAAAAGDADLKGVVPEEGAEKTTFSENTDNSGGMMNDGSGHMAGDFDDFNDDHGYMDPAQEEFDLMMKEVTEHLANSEHTANLLFEMMPLCDSWDQATDDKPVL
jgi:hypothetical protein